MSRLIFFIVFFLRHSEVLALNVLVYDDVGVFCECVQETLESLRSQLAIKYYIRTVKAEELRGTDWMTHTALLVFPGGIASDYAKQLNGDGNNLIRGFVESGGSYLGLCGGGYYGGAMVDFVKGTDQALLKSHELAFFPGTVVGPALKAYDYLSNQGECIAEVNLIYDTDFWLPGTGKFYYNGGGYFKDASTYPDTQVVASYRTLKDNPAAIIKAKVALGVAVLSGVHFETHSDTLKKIDPQCNVASAEMTRHKLLRYVLTLLNLALRPDQAFTLVRAHT
jgi:glutamine amidotransferase-like uncharacterized protein